MPLALAVIWGKKRGNNRKVEKVLNYRIIDPIPYKIILTLELAIGIFCLLLFCLAAVHCMQSVNQSKPVCIAPCVVSESEAHTGGADTRQTVYVRYMQYRTVQFLRYA